MKKNSTPQKRSVGRPQGTTKQDKRIEIIDFKLRIDKEEKEIIAKGFKKMGLDMSIRGSKKKFIMGLIKEYIKK